MKEINLKKIKQPYFIGIGGIGISAIARMLILDGKKVSGSDVAKSKVTTELQKLRAKIFIGQNAKNIPQDCDLVIYTIAVTPDNPEFAESKKRGIPMLSYPEALGLISKNKYTIAVAGTHGKTTTTAMIAKIMIDAKSDPTVIVGSFLKDSKSNFIAGKSQYLVVEACEYRRSFLNIHPTIVVITNIDNDHLDYYKDIKDIIFAFSEFVGKVPKNGFVVTNVKDKNIKPVIKNLVCGIIDYKKNPPAGGLKVPGAHNKENAATALAVAEILGIDKKSAIKSLENFGGTWRRFEYKGKTAGGALVYDDYAHHPTEIKATLAGARELYPKQRIVVAFQPHLYSRTKILLNDFAHAFKDADEIILAPIYAAREPFDSKISSEILAEKIKKLTSKKVSTFPDFQNIENYLRQSLKSGDILITMGAGEQNKIAEDLLKEFGDIKNDQ
ncbi:MAG: UDP-N-acetylmuramate--L-alanine ligase [Candidatus Paceibacterota bacterium]|jgi:UDP-N-acetylmuramate--alanine ligase